MTIRVRERKQKNGIAKLYLDTYDPQAENTNYKYLFAKQLTFYIFTSIKA